MAHRILSALIMGAFFVLPLGAWADVPPAAIHAMTKSTVILHGDEAQSNEEESVGLRDTNYCSGFVVGRAGIAGQLLIVATARHCVTTTEEGRTTSDVKPSYVLFRDGDRAMIIDTVVSGKDDVAVLYVQPMRNHPVPFLKDSFALGQSLYVYGMPNGFTWTLGMATAAQGSHDFALSFDAKSRAEFKDKLPRWARSEMITCTGCGPGDSGGGVWDSQGHVVGIAVAGGGDINLIEPIHLVQELLAGGDSEAPIHALLDSPQSVEWQ